MFDGDGTTAGVELQRYAARSRQAAAEFEADLYAELVFCMRDMAKQWVLRVAETTGSPELPIRRDAVYHGLTADEAIATAVAYEAELAKIYIQDDSLDQLKREDSTLHVSASFEQKATLPWKADQSC